LLGDFFVENSKKKKWRKQIRQLKNQHIGFEITVIKKLG
jgi:hypothetical protein